MHSFCCFCLTGKIGAILASIPQALAAAMLCFIWALIVALGLSTLQYSQTACFRNTTIVGVSLFLGLSIPAYFQQYQPESSLILPSYLLPYASASNGPVNTGNKQVSYFLIFSIIVTKAWLSYGWNCWEEKNLLPLQKRRQREEFLLKEWQSKHIPSFEMIRNIIILW